MKTSYDDGTDATHTDLDDDDDDINFAKNFASWQIYSYFGHSYEKFDDSVWIFLRKKKNQILDDSCKKS